MSVLTCPVCQGAMREVARDGVIIDTCTQCRGVWLDRGELEKIAASVSGQAPQPAAPREGGFLPAGLAGDRPRRGRGYDDDDDYDDRRDSYGQPRKSRVKSFMDFFD